MPPYALLKIGSRWYKWVEKVGVGVRFLHVNQYYMEKFTIYDIIEVHIKQMFNFLSNKLSDAS